MTLSRHLSFPRMKLPEGKKEIRNQLARLMQPLLSPNFENFATSPKIIMTAGIRSRTFRTTWSEICKYLLAFVRKIKLILRWENLKQTNHKIHEFRLKKNIDSHSKPRFCSLEARIRSEKKTRPSPGCQRQTVERAHDFALKKTSGEKLMCCTLGKI